MIWNLYDIIYRTTHKVKIVPEQTKLKIPEANYHVSSRKILICKTHTTTQSCNVINLSLLDVNNWHSKCGCFFAPYLLLGNDEK